jgi:hypothetical protein
VAVLHRSHTSRFCSALEQFPHSVALPSRSPAVSSRGIEKKLASKRGWTAVMVPLGAAVRRRERKRRIKSARQERLLAPAAANLVSAPAAHAPAPLPKLQREIVLPPAPEQKLPSAHIPEQRLKKKHRKKTAKEMKTRKEDLPAGSSPPTNEELDLWATQLAVKGVWPPASAKKEEEDGGRSDSHKISTVLKPNKEIKEQNNHVEKEMIKKVAIQPEKKRTSEDGEAEDANFEEVGKVEVGQRKRKRSDGCGERERKKGEREGGMRKESQREDISEPSAASTCFGSIKESQALISRFHTLQKYLAAVAVDPTLLSEAAREKRRCEIRAKLEALGGLDAYQKASIFGAEADESGAFNSGVWVKNELRNMGLLPLRSPARLRLLDVGALQDHWSPHADTVDAMVSTYSVLPL